MNYDHKFLIPEKALKQYFTKTELETIRNALLFYEKDKKFTEQYKAFVRELINYFSGGLIEWKK